ncbi:YeiH family protein [Gordonia hydrophobica]|uniref:YeiH family protein n=1 Tax=Gordonia hydrophobica TaxID=40516 RepID=A0ABZ2U4W1_9ACTN|nr:YeiH family protein [Gordonia hydrophobica]MBM7368278.1 putative integral membrane protein (TIGR00698 family) [Gordonia hydrophobica]
MTQSLKRRTHSDGESPARRRLGGIAPGLAVCGAIALTATGINYLAPAVSPLLLAIVIAAVVANLVPVPAVCGPGVTFSAKVLLRIGVALLGLQLVLGDVLGLGFGVLLVVVAIVVGGITAGLLIGKALGIPYARRLLISCGMSICGAAAVAGVEGVTKADEEDTATAVGTVVLFGTLMIPVIPLASNAMGLSEETAGMWAGGSIHEVAQVVAAGGMIGTSALTLAVVVKLARVMMLAPIVTVLSIRQRRLTGDAGKRPPIVPMFVIGFIACAILRSVGILPDGIISAGKVAQTVLLTVAMSALGLGVRLQVMRRVGWRPFVQAAATTAVVAGIALGGVLIAG